MVALKGGWKTEDSGLNEDKAYKLRLGRNIVKEIEFEESITQNAKYRTYKELEKLSDLDDVEYIMLNYMFFIQKYGKE